MSQMLKLSAPISELRPVVAALRFDSFRSAMHDIHDITDREPCERLAMHQLTAGESAVGHSRRFGFVRFRGIADMNS